VAHLKDLHLAVAPEQQHTLLAVRTSGVANEAND
jgi:hypothetical protein